MILQNDLKNIEKWCQVNKMIINVEKTKAMVISTKQKQTRSIENFNLNLFLNDSKLKLVTEQKLLGILVTNTLNWNEHVNHVCKKISKGIFALKKLKLYMDLKTRNLFQASTLTQNDTGPVGPVTPTICWSCKIFTGPTFFL